MPLSATGMYSRLLLDYVANKDDLTPFYGERPTLAGIFTQIKARQSFSMGQRRRLQEVLHKQYSGLKTGKQVSRNLSAITQPNTFVITTAQQLNLCMGPLYLAFKILTTIALVCRLQKSYPAYHFVPLFWMHTEDHDTTEVDHLYVRFKRYTVAFPQGGPAGELSAAPVAALLRELPGAWPVFEEAYTAGVSLATATQRVLHSFFGKHGLLVLDPMSAVLKKEVLPQLLSLDVQGRIEDAFTQQSNKLKQLGYKLQIASRTLHFFYLAPGFRGAIQRVNKGFRVAGSDVTFASTQDLLQAVEQHPERFSPSAALRPLYQEAVLPNLAYVGGAAEIAYWMQLKGVFKEINLSMPVLIPRLFGAVIPAVEQRKCQTLGLQWPDIFLKPKQQHAKLLPSISQYDLSKEQTYVQAMFKNIADKVTAVDNTLQAYVQHQALLSIRSLENIADKVRKKLLAQNVERKNTADALHAFLCPAGGPQERRLGIMSFLATQPTFLSALIDIIDPFGFHFHFIYLDNE